MLLVLEKNKESLFAAIPTDFHAEQALVHDNPFRDFSNIVNDNFSPSMEALNTLDGASKYRLLLQKNNMQHPMMHHNQIHSMNFEPSSSMIYGNPASISQNFNFNINTYYSLI